MLKLNYAGPHIQKKNPTRISIQTFSGLPLCSRRLENPPAGLRRLDAQRCSLVPYECRNGLNRAPQPGSPTQHAL